MQTDSYKWSLVFFGMSVGYISECLVFVLLASGEEQAWAKSAEYQYYTDDAGIDDTERDVICEPADSDVTIKS